MMPDLLLLWAPGVSCKVPGLLLLLFLLFFSSPTCCQLCPVSCECSEAARTVKCVQRDLERVPTDIPGYTRNLFITGNRISRVATGALRGLPNLVTLSLANNRINTLEMQAFSSLANLRYLDLSNNILTTIHPSAFSIGNNSIQELNLSHSLYNFSAIQQLADAISNGGFHQLSKLEMSDNGIVYLPSGMFSGLSSLQRLDLKNNSLVDIKNFTFAGLDLERLDLTLNAIKTLRMDTLIELGKQPSLQLFLKDNPFVCNCDIEDLVEWLNTSRKVADMEKLTCVFPQDLQNTSLISLGETVLGCHTNQGHQNTLQTSYVFLSVVLGFVGVVFLFVLYLNRKGIKMWINNMRDACRDLMEGYHYQYEIDSDPRVTRVSTSDV
ncbi:trophoblast glycoprotein-like [Microcaecilia unicolor]|uniref:Trophoblast glycoprotein-like n=1 Tax=Microcaecilia unicolor TaxID=1415580 RepID=A0A6P7ZIU2_9AMPH|nr:trophoblast glycoprotein-like [Microcaecilia unicolor]